MPYQVTTLNSSVRFPKRGMIPRGTALYNGIVQSLPVETFLSKPLVSYECGIRELMLNISPHGTDPSAFNEVLYEVNAITEPQSVEEAGELGFVPDGIIPQKLLAALKDDNKRQLIETGHQSITALAGPEGDLQKFLCRFGAKWAVYQPMVPVNMIDVFLEKVPPDSAEAVSKHFKNFLLAMHPECFDLARLARAELTALTLQKFPKWGNADPSYREAFLIHLSRELYPLSGITGMGDDIHLNSRYRFLYRVARFWAEANDLPVNAGMQLITPISSSLFPIDRAAAYDFRIGAKKFWETERKLHIPSPDVVTSLRFLTYGFEKIRAIIGTRVCQIRYQEPWGEGRCFANPNYDEWRNPTLGPQKPIIFIGSVSPSVFHIIHSSFDLHTPAHDQVGLLWEEWCSNKSIGYFTSFDDSPAEKGFRIQFHDMKPKLVLHDGPPMEDGVERI